MESEGRSSTGSTVSGVFKTILQSPTPICMFYFSHPFGVSTPQIRESRSSEKNGMSPYNTFTSKKPYQRDRLERNGFYYDSSQRNRINSHQSQDGSIRLIPWPRNTWKREFVLPPLIQFRGKRNDGLAPDLESVLRTIRQAWNSPTGISSYIQNQKNDCFWKQFCNQDYVNEMGSGTNQSTTCNRLLKRRYSVPEIIMRKHELAQQRPYDDYITESAPSSKMPPSTGITNSNSTSSISRNMFTVSPGSDGNLSRGPEKEISLRKSSLLRQMWEKETRLRHGKTSSLLLSSQKGFSAEGGDSHCEECKRLNISRDVDDMEPISRKYFSNGRLKKLKTPASTETSSSMSDVSPSTSQISTQESLGSKQGQYTTTDTSEIFGHYDTKRKLPLQTDFSNGRNDENGPIDNILTESTSNVQEENIAAREADSDDSALDNFISQMLIENLRDLAEEARMRCRKKKYIDCFQIKPNILPPSEGDTTLQGSDDSRPADSVTTPCTLEVAANEESCRPTSNTEESVHECIESSSDSTSQIHLDEVPSTDVIQISAGSTYPPYNTEGAQIIVPRVLKLLPRTESIEVQPSSASMVEEDNNYSQNSDESLSLVDSLDDPAVEGNDEMTPPRSEKEDFKCEDQQQKEKSQAFFVPIIDSGQENMEDVPVVAETMPEKLKERIEQRQLELDAKKECYRKSHHTVENVSTNSGSEIVREIKSKTKKHSLSMESRSRSRSSRDSKQMLRNDIGLLESYTVDSKGNLQFRAPQKTKSKTMHPGRSKIIKKQSIVTTRPPKPVKSSTSSSSHSKKSKSSPKDIQKMTIFQTQSDIITPDHENGPRRIYQKTEIQDGEKRIEILEIVECVESSDEGSPIRQSKLKCIAKSACLRRSKIPVPIYKIGRSAGCQKPARIRESTQYFGRSSPRDMHQGSLSPKVDRAIAELLIGALNRSDQAVIEVIRSPKEIFSTRSSRGQITSRRNTPKRSTSSGRYRQIFEVIPEEKSSLSMDSSNEESSKDTKDSKSSRQTSTDIKISESITTCSNTTKTVVTTTTTSTSSPPLRTPNRGRDAVESTEAKDWIGFFKCHDNSIDEDEDEATQPYASSTTENSRQHTITSPSTVTAAQGSSTPKNTSSATYPGSSESDNILKVIEKSIPKTGKNNFAESSPADSSKQSEPCTAPEHQKHCGNIIQVKECKGKHIAHNISVCPETKHVLDEKCLDSSNVNVWRVQSPDICKRAIPKSKNCAPFEKCSLVETETEIDSRSFVICSDDSILHPSDQVDSSTTLNDLHGHVECRKEFLNMCTTCCFCNPDLHNTKSEDSEYCVYCNRKKTPQKKEEETNTESDYFKKQDTYQSTSIKDHTHTMSRDSDSVSTKCTRTNEKIKRYMPDSSRASNSESCGNTKKNIHRPKNVNNLPKSERKAVKKVIQDEVKGKAPQKRPDGTESKFGPFPSPYKNLSSYGYDRSTSPTSSSDSTCPTTPERRMLFPKMKCKANKTKSKKSKVATTKDVKTEENTENKSATVAGNGANTGWTVTLAGSCSQGPPPDVEMRLSFPKDQATKNLPIDRSEGNNDAARLEGVTLQDGTLDNNGNARRSSVLPPAVNVDTRRALPNNVTGGTFQKELVFPEVGSNTPRSQLVPRHITKKAIRHLECNVAVTSATRTFSNFTRGRRTMSYQALNGDPQKLSSRERQIRDSSLDLGFLSSRRLSIESQSPLESMALSIMGNAIAPEQKPRVPTMSEKDLTRRHNRCFTRNRAFFT